MGGCEEVRLQFQAQIADVHTCRRASRKAIHMFISSSNYTPEIFSHPEPDQDFSVQNLSFLGPRKVGILFTASLCWPIITPGGTTEQRKTRFLFLRDQNSSRSFSIIPEIGILHLSRFIHSKSQRSFFHLK